MRIFAENFKTRLNLCIAGKSSQNRMNMLYTKKPYVTVINRQIC